MAIGQAGLDGLALLAKGLNTRGAAPSSSFLLPSPALSPEARATPEAQLLARAVAQSQTAGTSTRSSPFIRVPASPLASSTLQALQQSSQQFAVREQTVAEEVAAAPERELKRALASVTRETTSTTTSPATTQTTTVDVPAQTTTRTVTETVTVPGPESSGVQELRQVLDNAAARAGGIEDRGNGRASDRQVGRLTDSVERRGDRLLDALESAVDRGGSRVERRINRALEGQGGALAKSIDRLFDRGGERGVSAFDQLVTDNAARIVQTFGKVLEATGSTTSKKLEDLLVKAGPEAIAALKDAVDSVRPTVTQEVTHDVTTVIPGHTETVTTTIPGTTTTSTVSSASTIQTETPAEQAQATVRRQVEAYSNTSRLIAPLQELATPPAPVPNPAANLLNEDQSKEAPLHGPIRRDDKQSNDQRTSRADQSSAQQSRSEEIRLRQPLVFELASDKTDVNTLVASNVSRGIQTAAPPGTLVNIAS